jgi:hypothetical protein
MTPTTYGLIFALGLFVAMILLLELGRRIAIRRLLEDPVGAREGLGVVEGAVFSLLGLLIAFTFSGAATRFDARRQLIVEEANDIGTAYLRIDLLPDSAQPALRDLFRRYVDARLAIYEKIPDIEAAKVELAKSQVLQQELWSNAVAACRESGSQPAHMLLLPAINPMFDIATTRIEAVNIHPPLVIFIMIGVLMLGAALLAGYGMGASKSRSLAHVISFATVMALTVYVIIDIEYPRVGLITVEKSDRVLMDLRASFK